jgi:hypothetical protein
VCVVHVATTLEYEFLAKLNLVAATKYASMAGSAEGLVTDMQDLRAKCADSLIFGTFV